METILKKWGNSISVRLPASVLKEARLTENQRVEIEAKRGAIVIKPLQVQRYKLDELLRGITPKNRHEAIEFGRPVGKEQL